MLIRRILFAALVALAVGPAPAQANRDVFQQNGVAVRGTDVVAYFTESRPRAGDPRFTVEWMGATWRFATEDHRALFAADPARYAPAYGGFCAFGVAQGYKVEIDPTAWRIVDGRLYLNYSTGVNRDWSRDIPGNLAKSEANWPRLLGK